MNKQLIQKLLLNTKAGIMDKGLSLAIGALVVLLVAAVVLPIAANQTAAAANNPNLTFGSGTLMSLLPLFVIIGLVVIIVGFAIKEFKGKE